MPHPPQLRIGISGWRYAPWRGVFYPNGLPQKSELHFASRQFNSIEINGTFYSLQTPASFQAWYSATPANFLFSLKAPRFITHMRRLKNADQPLANFFASGILALHEKLGPLLWQLPPNFKFDPPVLDAFFEKLPRTLAAAASLASSHGPQLKAGPFIPTLSPAQQKQKLRHALEKPHASFLTPPAIKLLRQHNIALVIADTANLHPYAEDVTADFLYLRLHGHEQIYASGYSEPALAHWAQRLRDWSQGREPADAQKVLPTPPKPRKSRDLYVYFDNDIKVHAPFNAQSLATKLHAP